jgi:hypothetical protein
LPDSNYGDERFAFTIVFARNGHRLRRIEGEPIIWKWMFWADDFGPRLVIVNHIFAEIEPFGFDLYHAGVALHSTCLVFT